MTEITTTVQIDRPRSEVFAYLTDLRNAPEWSTELLRRTFDGDEVELGTTGVDELRALGRVLVTPWQVTEYLPPESIAIEFGGALSATSRFSFEEADSGASTVMTCVTDLHLRGAILRMLTPLVAMDARRADEAQFRRAKEIIESRAGKAEGAEQGRLK
ncbi:SRPBCC family protein [Agromyces humatus]|uniref:Polyketide cyclase n=1 Tax=Agromyces humatus TaxID=279573 RepID=A0ABN2KGH8_9MICO|nr:SRPBCC family protein [Agromyces humatus]